MRNKILVGITAAVAAAAIAAPAQAQVVSPAQPSSPTPETTIRFGNCTVAESSHGYAYAVCSVVADNVPYGQAASISYKSSLRTFKPRTTAKWSGQTGTLTLTNDGSLPGQAPGTTSTVLGGIKLAFKGKSVAQVKQELIVAATGSTGAGITNPIAAPAQG